jgi:cytosine/adenosine deaminase-related metal-dependent hydrolase
MDNAVAKTTVDGLDGYEDATEGEQERGNRVIQGPIIKFTNDSTYELPDGEEVDPKREFIAVDIIRVVQRWHDAKPAETIVIGPHEKFPDVRKMNDAVHHYSMLCAEPIEI